MLAATSGVARRRLLGILDRLKADPFAVGDFREPDETGRPNEVWLIDDWLVTFWSDHGAAEVRIVNLERVED